MDRDSAEPAVRSFPGDRAAEWAEYHKRFAAPSTYVYEFVWDYTADAAGPFCRDVDGNVLMDFTSHVAAAPLGYNNPKILDPLTEFDLVDPLKIAGQDFYVAGGGTPENPEFPGPAQLMDRLTVASEHYGLDTVFLSNSGAEAVENAIKICYADSGGGHAVTFEGAFHGRTLGALSLNRSKGVQRRGYPEIAGVHEEPFCSDRTCTRETCECGFFTDGAGLAATLDPERGYLPADDVAYVIVEPIQGEGGYNIPSDAFMDEIAAVCEEYDVHLVADEIQSGLGRTGEMWAADHYSIEPDVIAAAKGLRVGATISRSDVFPEEEGRLSSTWGAGDVLSSLVGSLTVDAIHEHDLLDNATRRGDQLLDLLGDADLPGAVDARGKGLMTAVEFDGKERRDDVMEAALSEGLLTLGCGYRTLRLLPPLDATEREIRMGVELLSNAAEKVA